VSLRKSLRLGILYLTLDTPGAAVNVLTLDTAASLREALGDIDRATVRAVVLCSAKPASFLNGAGLLMLSRTVKSVEDVSRLVGPVREAYRAMRACPVPTVAAVRGNCYGCGVELSLQCRYRLASDDQDTRFRMTELADYLMIPTFGATQDLPRLLGLEQAADFLLWGPRWSARQALERGLVDGCFGPADFDRGVDAFVESVATPGDASSRRRPLPEASAVDLDTVQKRTRDRIRRLPPAYRDLYGTCFDLMQSVDGDAGYAREALEAARSALAPPSQAATPFFFMRQAAKTLAVEDHRDVRASSDSFETSAPRLADLCAELSGPTTGRVLLSERFQGEPLDVRNGVVVHAPFRAIGIEVVEVASLGAHDAATARAVSAALVSRYFSVVRTRPQRAFVIDDLLSAWLEPQLSYLRDGGDPSNLAASLRTFGFTRFPGDWVGALGTDALRALARQHGSTDADSSQALLALPPSTCDDGVDDAIVIRALLVSLGGFAARALRDRSVPHVTFVDVAARDVIDFPLLHTSLCRYLTLARCAELLQCSSTFRRLVSPESMSSFEQFTDRGRPFYQGHAHRQ
jgi:enoyl-CoA hydratase/carnithine racemase